MTDTLQSNVLTVAADGTIGADFTGKVNAQGIVFPAFTSTPSAATPSQIQWQRASDGAVLADIEAGEDVPTTGQQTQLFVIAESPDLVGNPIAGLEIAANLAGPSQFVEAFANGVSKIVLNGNGESSFLQLLSAQQLQLTLGTQVLAYPGGTPTSNEPTINTGIARPTLFAIAQFTGGIPDSIVGYVDCRNYANGSFTCFARHTANIALQNQTVAWLAIG